MEPKIISEYSYIKSGTLDHCYQLFSDGSVLYTYDASLNKGGINKKSNLQFVNLDSKVKEKLIENTTAEGQAIITANFLQNDNG